MKKILLALALILAAPVFAEEAKETKRVCVTVKKDGKDVIDPKTKKPKESCKQVKQHKKLEGTQVPGKQ
jgi:hypothetical protein